MGGEARGYQAAGALAKMGAAAAVALPRLLELARGANLPPRRYPGNARTARWVALCALANPGADTDRIIPVLSAIVRDPAAEETLRRTATFSLAELGGPAVNPLRALLSLEAAEARGWVVSALGKALEMSGAKTGKDFYTEMILANPFDPWPQAMAEATPFPSR